jgi:hypothetical protein
MLIRRTGIHPAKLVRRILCQQAVAVTGFRMAEAGSDGRSDARKQAMGQCQVIVMSIELCDPQRGAEFGVAPLLSEGPK